MKPEQPRIIPTGDGSQSLFLETLNETYHSTHGAVRETLHVFIEHGLRSLPARQMIKVFEVGFGTGLNAICALNFAEKHNIPIEYTTIEQYPLSRDVYENYNKGWLEENSLREQYLNIHLAEWNRNTKITGNFCINKVKNDWQQYVPGNEFDIIFYDAFAPGKQPEMWALPLLQRSFQMLRADGLLVTYCAQGQFKRDLVTCGFRVEVLPGPPGKKEMVQAWKLPTENRLPRQV